MNIKNLIIGGIAGGILFFLLGWLIYGNLLAGFMQANAGTATGVNKATPDMLYLVAGNLCSGFLMAYIFTRANVNSLVSGLITGGIVGLLMASAMDCIMYGTTNIASKKMILADVLAATAMSAIVGAVVGLLLGKLNKSS